MISIPKGTKDMLPADSYKWRAVENAAHSVAARYNAKQIRTPVFESADLFLRSIGDETDIVGKEMYLFEDKGGRKMALRPEGTAGVMRSFIENNLGETLPVKTYYIESVYRYEQPQAGRYREHHQFGVEFFGSERPEFDVEALCLANDFLKTVGFPDIAVQINSIGCPECRARYNAALREFLAGVSDKVCSDCKRRAVTNPLRALDCKVRSCRELYKNVPLITDYLCDGCKAHYGAVLAGLAANGIKYIEDPLLVRGIDYYTRTVFEFVSGGLTVLAGGRYDGLCEQLGGKHTPCVGFGCGLERIIESAERLGICFKKPTPCVFVAAQNDSARAKCAELVRVIRQKGLSAEYDLMGKSLKSQFKYADRQNFTYVITVGETELAEDRFGIRRMSDGATAIVKGGELAEFLASPNSGGAFEKPVR